MNLKHRLIIMNFLQFAVWGTYLTSMSRYLGPAGMGEHIGLFYSVQGLVSIFMPTLFGILADRYVPAQRMLALCHLASGLFMAAAGAYGLSAGPSVAFGTFFALYTLGVAFYMPTLALSYSVAYSLLEQGGYDTVRDFPPIRIFGTIGFICSMWAVDLTGFQTSAMQFVICGALGTLLAHYAFTLPHIPVSRSMERKSFVEALGLNAFRLFRKRQMAVFFIFSMMLGVSLQITNGFANPFIASFESVAEYADTFGVQHANILISLSQVSETLCILLIPFFLRRYGIKTVVLIAMVAWILRFALFGIGNPGGGVWLLVLSMIVYGVAFDFFNISGSLFVDRETDPSIRSSAQALFFLMTSGVGATVGTLGAQAVVNAFCQWTDVETAGGVKTLLVGDWSTVWYLFAGYSLLVTVFFAILFPYKHKREG